MSSPMQLLACLKLMRNLSMAFINTVKTGSIKTLTGCLDTACFDCVDDCHQSRHSQVVSSLLGLPSLMEKDPCCMHVTFAMRP